MGVRWQKWASDGSQVAAWSVIGGPTRACMHARAQKTDLDAKAAMLAATEEQLQQRAGELRAERAQVEAARAHVQADSARVEAERTRVEADRVRVEADGARAEAERACVRTEQERLKALEDSLQQQRSEVSAGRWVRRGPELHVMCSIRVCVFVCACVLNQGAVLALRSSLPFSTNGCCACKHAGRAGVFAVGHKHADRAHAHAGRADILAA